MSLSIEYHELTGKDFPEDHDDQYDLLEDIIADPTCSQRLKELYPEISRGDVVAIAEMEGYRNDGKMMWDGNKLESLGYDDAVDDYGHVPNTYLVGDEFDTHHWEDSIDHNEYVWIDAPRHRDQLLSNMTPTGTFFQGDKYKITIKFDSHSLFFAMHCFRKMVEEAKGPIHLPFGKDKGTLMFYRSLSDELRMLYPDSSICSHYGSHNGVSKSEYHIECKDGTKVVIAEHHGSVVVL